MTTTGAYSIEFDYERVHNYIERRWTDSILLTIVYITVIFTGRRLMRDRPAFDLRAARVIWNGALAVFSIIGTLRCLPEMFRTLRTNNFEYSICVIDLTHENFPTAGTWAALFALSKVVELGDTVFIVLRKQPLIFLHWYHHATVLIYVWFSYANYTAAGRWFICMNFVAHSFVYLYYTLAALRIRVPVALKIGITCTQILQMVIGVTINVWTYSVKKRGGICQQTYSNILWSSIMYFTYFLLFAHFFHKAYLKSAQTTGKKIN